MYGTKITKPGKFGAYEKKRKSFTGKNNCVVFSKLLYIVLLIFGFTLKRIIRPIIDTVLGKLNSVVT
jgi:hypothetical protein